MVTPNVHANTIREALGANDAVLETDGPALAALDALAAQAETAVARVEMLYRLNQNQIDLVRAAEAERDAAVQARETERVFAVAQIRRAEAAEQAAEQAEARITELHATLERTNESYLAAEQAAEQAHAALQTVFDQYDAMALHYGDEPEDWWPQLYAARAALAGNPKSGVLMDATDQQAIADAGLPVRCCDNWPECSHVAAALAGNQP